MKWVSLWSYFSEPITTLKLDLACQISNGFNVVLLIHNHKEERTKLLIFYFLFFLQNRESYVLSCSISNNEKKLIWSWGNISSIIVINMCLRLHINVAYFWQIYCRKRGHFWLSGEIILVAISIYDRLQDKDEIAGHTNA